MLNKKKYISKWLLLSFLIVSCTNYRDSEKLEISETKIPNKQNELNNRNIPQYTVSVLNLSYLPDFCPAFD